MMGDTTGSASPSAIQSHCTDGGMRKLCVAIAGYRPIARMWPVVNEPIKQHIFILADSRIFVLNQKMKVNFAHEFICPFFLAKRVENNVKSSTLKRRNSCEFFYMQTKCHVLCLFVCFWRHIKKKLAQ